MKDSNFVGKDEMKKELFFGDPNQKGKFHIFEGESRRSLCGRWCMPFTQFDENDLVRGTENCGENDCKKCFEKLNQEHKRLSKK